MGTPPKMWRGSGSSRGSRTPAAARYSHLGRGRGRLLPINPVAFGPLPPRQSGGCGVGGKGTPPASVGGGAVRDAGDRVSVAHSSFDEVVPRELPGPSCTVPGPAVPDNPGVLSLVEEPAVPSKRRRDAPPVVLYSRGNRLLALAIAADPSRLTAAIGALEDAAYATTTKGPRAARRTLWEDVLSEVCKHHPEWDPEVLSPESLRAGAAVLKAAHYRSAFLVVLQAKQDHIANGHPWTPALQLEVQRAKRAC